MPNETDEIVRAYVKRRDRYRCRYCGSDHDADWAHIRTRSMRYIRWETELMGVGNSVVLCRRHHEMFHASPDTWRAYVETMWPGLWDQLGEMEREGQRSGRNIDEAQVQREHEEKFLALS